MAQEFRMYHLRLLFESGRIWLKPRGNLLAPIEKRRNSQVSNAAWSFLAPHFSLWLHGVGPVPFVPAGACSRLALHVSRFSFGVRVSSRTFNSYCFSSGPLPIPVPITVAKGMQCSDSLGPGSHAPIPELGRQDSTYATWTKDLVSAGKKKKKRFPQLAIFRSTVNLTLINCFQKKSAF